MNAKTDKFTLADLVMLGVYNAVLLFFYYGIIMLLHFFPILWGAMDPIINFALAPIFLLMLARVPRSGVLTLHGVIIGLAHLLTGWWPGLIAGLAADGLARLMGGYGHKAAAIAGILAFVTVKALVFYAPLYLFVYFPVFADVVTMWPKEYIEKYTLYYAVGFLALNFVACSAGIYWGSRVLKRSLGNFNACPEK